MKSQYLRKRDKLDKIHSEYIRQHYADQDGFVRCITCGKVVFWNIIQCGHFISRKYLPVRWEFKNTAPQCKSCNVFNQGEQYKFSVWIEQTFGKGTVEMLEIKKNNRIKLDAFTLQAMIDEYKLN